MLRHMQIEIYTFAAQANDEFRPSFGATGIGYLADKEVKDRVVARETQNRSAFR